MLLFSVQHSRIGNIRAIIVMYKEMSWRVLLPWNDVWNKWCKRTPSQLRTQYLRWICTTLNWRVMHNEIYFGAIIQILSLRYYNMWSLRIEICLICVCLCADYPRYIIPGVISVYTFDYEFVGFAQLKWHPIMFVFLLPRTILANNKINNWFSISLYK